MRIILAAAALLLSSAAAFADDMQDCRSNDPVRAIGACSLVLQSKTESKTNQVAALGYRALAYMRKNELDLANADVKRALELDPKYVFAMSLRGELHMRANRYDRALADFNAALKLQPGVLSRRSPTAATST